MDPNNWPGRRRACRARPEARSYTTFTGAAERRQSTGEPRAAHLMGAAPASASAAPRGPAAFTARAAGAAPRR
jgi:hypothetical protein